MRLHRFAVFNVMHKLFAEMFGKTAHRENSGICQRADGAPCHVIADAV